MCSKLLKVFSTLAVVFFVFFLLSCTAGAFFYEENNVPLLDNAGVYGGHYIYFQSYNLYEVLDDDKIVLWIPENYVDYFSSDDNAVVNISSSTITLYGFDFEHTRYTFRFPSFSYLQIRTLNSPYTYYDIDYMDILDTNIQIQGENSPFYNDNLHWSYDTKIICFFLGFQTIALIIGGGIYAKSRN